MPTPPRDLASRLRRRLDRARASGQQGAAVLRILSRTGLIRALRPQHVARFARSARGSKPGPHLALMLHAHVFPDKLAVADPRRRLTYGELLAATDRLAADLARYDVRAGQRIGVWLSSRIESLIALLACSKSGAICCPSLHRDHTVGEVVLLWITAQVLKW